MSSCSIKSWRKNTTVRKKQLKQSDPLLMPLSIVIHWTSSTEISRSVFNTSNISPFIFITLFAPFVLTSYINLLYSLRTFSTLARILPMPSSRCLTSVLLDTSATRLSRPQLVELQGMWHQKSWSKSLMEFNVRQIVFLTTTFY